MALSTVDAGKCAFMCSLTVVIVPVILAVFYGKPIKPTNIISGAMAIAGVGILEGVVDLNQFFAVQPALADAASTVVTNAADTTPVIAANVVEASSMTVSSATSTVGESSGWLSSLASSLGLTKGDLLAFGQPFGFGISFLRIEHYVEKFKDVENRIMTISAGQCIAVGLLSLVWVLFDFHGTLPNFGYMVSRHNANNSEMKRV